MLGYAIKGIAGYKCHRIGDALLKRQQLQGGSRLRPISLLLLSLLFFLTSCFLRISCFLRTEKDQPPAIVAECERFYMIIVGLFASACIQQNHSCFKLTRFPRFCFYKLFGRYCMNRCHPFSIGRDHRILPLRDQIFFFPGSASSLPIAWGCTFRQSSGPTSNGVSILPR